MQLRVKNHGFLEASAMDSMLDAFFSKRIKSEYDVDEKNVLDGLNVPSKFILSCTSKSIS